MSGPDERDARRASKEAAARDSADEPATERKAKELLATYDLDERGVICVRDRDLRFGGDGAGTDSGN